MAQKPDIIVELEVREKLIRFISEQLQTTQIPMYRLEPIVKEIYNDIKIQANDSITQLANAYNAALQREYDEQLAQEKAEAANETIANTPEQA
jgi:uncharacterized phage-associated protein